MAFQSQRRERPDPAALDLHDGTVTRVARQQKDPDRASVFVDDRFAFGLAVDLAVEAGLRKGVRLTADEQRALLVRQETFAAKAAALNLLSHRARTVGEVRRSLAHKGFAESVVDETVEALERLGYLDDRAFAEQFVRDRFAARGHGPSRLRADLVQKGVARATIDAALAGLEEAADVDGAARDLAAGRWRQLASEPDGRKRRKKTLDFLLRRGYPFDAAREAVETVAADEPDDDEA